MYQKKVIELQRAIVRQLLGVRTWKDQASTSFPGLQCEDEGRDEEALVWAGHVSTQKMAAFDSYSSRSGKIFFNEIYKSSKEINSQKTSRSILFMCRAKFGTNQLKSMKSMFSKIYRYFWRFSTTGKAASKLHLGVSMRVRLKCGSGYGTERMRNGTDAERNGYGVKMRNGTERIWG